MVQHWQLNRGRSFLFRLNPDDDLLDGLNQFVHAQQLSCGTITGIGALIKANLGFYDHISRSYKEVILDEVLEITCLVGNISIRDGKPFVHAHLTVSNAQGICYGGHLMPGCKVFACEVAVSELEGDNLPLRAHDKVTGLYLWKKGSDNQ